jgi:ATP-dependent DNA helicase RecQ
VLLHSYPDRFTHEYFIDGANPDRPTIEAAWRTFRARADRDGFVDGTLDDLTQRLPPKLGERKVGSAVRALVAAGALTIEPPAPGRVFVRLMATPERITAELAGDRAFDREVLRALWRAVGTRLEHGASIDLDGLPPGLGGASGVLPVLDRLQAEQFVTVVRTGGGFRLDARSRDAAWLPVDWRALERRRQADLARLDAMQRYAQARGCRRGFVLRYFGDPDARSSCGACDRCLGTTRTAVAPAAGDATRPSRRARR